MAHQLKQCAGLGVLDAGTNNASWCQGCPPARKGGQITQRRAHTKQHKREGVQSKLRDNARRESAGYKCTRKFGPTPPVSYTHLTLPTICSV
eukprot:14513019-Alexandrium_andersonii.AAC.1